MLFDRADDAKARSLASSPSAARDRALRGDVSTAAIAVGAQPAERRRRSSARRQAAPSATRGLWIPWRARAEPASACSRRLAWRMLDALRRFRRAAAEDSRAAPGGRAWALHDAGPRRGRGRQTDSHRRAIALFAQSVGLTPSACACFASTMPCAVWRDTHARLIDVALDAGFSDNPISREFVAFAGVTLSTGVRFTPILLTSQGFTLFMTRGRANVASS